MSAVPAADDDTHQRPAIASKLRVIVLVLVAMHIVGVVTMIVRLPPDIAGHFVASDALRYTQIGLTPRPYVDHPVEVPPVEVLALRTVASPDARTTAIRNAVAQLLLGLFIAWAISLGWGPMAAAAYLALSLPLAPFLAFRLDLLSVALATLGLALSRREAPRSGGILLGLAVLTKLWPAGIGMALICVRRGRALVWMIATTVVAMAAWVGLAPSGPAQVLSFRSAAGWQIESGVGALALATTSDPVIFESGANRIGVMSFGLRAGLGLAMLATIGLITFLGRSRSAEPDPPKDLDALVVLGVTGALLIFAPILSWQYVAWILPWLAIAVSARRWSITVAGVAVILLTAWLLFLGVPLTQRDPVAIAVVVARNVALVTLLATTILALWRIRGGRLAP